MAGNLSPGAKVRLAALGEFVSRVQHVHGLVEMFTTSKASPEQYLLPIQRAFGKLKLQFMGAGLDSLSQLCGSMEMAARRGFSPAAKGRILREGVGSLKFQLELAQRSVISDEKAAARQSADEKDEAATS